MKPPAGKWDYLAIAGLRRKKKSPEFAKYASFNRRMWALTIDSVLLIFAAPLIQMISPVTLDIFQLLQQVQEQTTPQERVRIFREGLSASGWIANAKTQIVVMLICTGTCWHFWAATPGKMLMRLKIVDAKTEKPISDYQICLRLGGYVISACAFMLGFIWINFNKRRRGWHDIFADTVVIIQPWKKDATPGTATADRSGSPAPSAKE